jgi:phage gpG-like protein
MLQISLDDAAEFSARLDVLPDQLRAALTEKVQALASALYAQVVGVNLSGSILNARSGALRDSIQIEVQAQDARIDAKIFSDGDVPYAAILEFGGKTAAHEILPDKTRALAFLTNGKQVFARRIQHPGSTFAARSYLGGALDDASGEIVATLREVIAAAAEQLRESR